MNENVPARSGRPRLVATTGGHALAGSPEAEGRLPAYRLEGDLVTIGSQRGQDIVVAGLRPRHAEIRRLPDEDEYVFVPLGPDASDRVDAAVVTLAGLHHGDRVTIGDHTFIFQRDEFADHVRSSDDAREGGDYAGGGITDAGGDDSEPD
jgi:hypothetical protein